MEKKTTTEDSMGTEILQATLQAIGAIQGMGCCSTDTDVKASLAGLNC